MNDDGICTQHRAAGSIEQGTGTTQHGGRQAGRQAGSTRRLRLHFLGSAGRRVMGASALVCATHREREREYECAKGGCVRDRQRVEERQTEREGGRAGAPVGGQMSPGRGGQK